MNNFPTRIQFYNNIRPRLHETGRMLIRMKIRQDRLRVHTRPAYPLKVSTRIRSYFRPPTKADEFVRYRVNGKPPLFRCAP